MNTKATPSFKPDGNSWIEHTNYFFTKDSKGNTWYCVIEEEGSLVHNLLTFEGYKFSIPYGILNQRYYTRCDRNFEKKVSDDGLFFSMVEVTK